MAPGSVRHTEGLTFPWTFPTHPVRTRTAHAVCAAEELSLPRAATCYRRAWPMINTDSIHGARSGRNSREDKEGASAAFDHVRLISSM